MVFKPCLELVLISIFGPVLYISIRTIIDIYLQACLPPSSFSQFFSSLFFNFSGNDTTNFKHQLSDHGKAKPPKILIYVDFQTWRSVASQDRAYKAFRWTCNILSSDSRHTAAGWQQSRPRCNPPSDDVYAGNAFLHESFGSENPPRAHWYMISVGIHFKDSRKLVLGDGEAEVQAVKVTFT